MDEKTKNGMGWLPDIPDFRDLTVDNKKIKPLLKTMGISETQNELPGSVDLRKWCSPVEDQGKLGSCTAHAGVGMLEYFERKAYGKHIDASRLFLYKTTRNLMQQSGDTGAFLRTTMSALVLFGVLPEEYYPYIIEEYDQEPPAFCYSYAQSYQALKYVNLDPPNTTQDELLARIKTNLAAGIPSMFGFTVYNSLWSAKNGEIPLPCPKEKVEGGHAIMVVGYHDQMEIENPNCGNKTTGALLIRNSWGSKWGEGGYGWLPYQYVLSGLAQDWWTLMDNEWFDSGEFSLE
ncbi:MAG: cysteine protease [Methanobacterium sp.]|jgi:C1A family cysteine protease|nr:cysteine protease [Methanobacterium sp.]